MKILIIIPSFPNYSGVDYHRLVVPHKRIGEMFSDIQLFQINEIDSATDEFLKQFDLVIANRFISKNGNVDLVIEKLNYAGTPYVIDIDDDYTIPDWHVLHKVSKEKKHAQQIIKGLIHAKAITCTHELLADHIHKSSHNKQIYIIPNGIYAESGGQFEPRPFYDKRVCFGWSGSVTHFDDVIELYDSLLAIYKDKALNHKYRFVYGGYEKTDHTSKAISGVLSCKGVAPDECFTMFPAQQVKGYANFYDHINVSMIPLRDNRFNNMKSNLKLIEAGFRKKAVIVSNVFPYSPLMRPGINCLAVNKKHDWYKHMIKLINNPQLIIDLGNRLYEDCQIQHIDVIAKLRYELYKQLISKKNDA